MQVVATRTPSTIPLRAVLYGVLASIGFVGGGLLIGWFSFGLGFVEQFTAARPSAAQMATGALAWGFALIAPALFLMVGLARLVDTLELLSLRRRRPRPVAAIAGSLPADHVAAARVRLPDGRVIPELVIGPFGVAVIEELPSPRLSRHQGGAWEARAADGRWRPIENPLERASRDAERVRRWLADDDRDHVVKVHAAIVAPEGSVARIPTCAVVAEEDLVAWLAALPVQRSLNGDRRAAIVEMVKDALV
jgi:hypothetical protein